MNFDPSNLLIHHRALTRRLGITRLAESDVTWAMITYENEDENVDASLSRSRGSCLTGLNAKW